MLNKLTLVFLASIAGSLLLLVPAWAKGLSITSITGATNGTSYHFYCKNDLDVGWTTTRPSKSDQKIKLCIPAAFTSTTGTVVGINALNGKVKNARGISKPIGGALLIRNGKFNIFPTSHGACFTEEFIESLVRDKASLFQQFQLVEKGVPARFKDKKIFQMRAIAKFKDGREGIVESVTPISFKEFNDDLAAMGVEDALYTDMGAWDEGWYRDPGSADIVSIGNDRSKTNKQTNWLIFIENNRN